MFSQLGIAVVVFASTNIDDILLLAALFSDRKLRPTNIVLGQFLGIGGLVAASAVAAMAVVVIPAGWMGLLGLIPFALGVSALVELIKGGEEDETEIREAEHRLQDRFHSQVLGVAGITIANGGDNLGVYIPLFSKDLSVIVLFATVFAIMTAIWCAAGYGLVNNRWIGRHVQRFGKIALPFVLMGLGLFILYEARVLLP